MNGGLKSTVAFLEAMVKEGDKFTSTGSTVGELHLFSSLYQLTVLLAVYSAACVRAVHAVLYG